MTVKCIVTNKALEDVTLGKSYEVIEIVKTWYRIIDDFGMSCLYPPELFRVIEA